MPVNILLLEGNLDGAVPGPVFNGYPAIETGCPKGSLAPRCLDQRRNGTPDVCYLRDRDYGYEPPAVITEPEVDRVWGGMTLGWRWCRHEIENYLLVLVSQIWRRIASGPEGEIPSGESIDKSRRTRESVAERLSPGSAEKLGELGDPGFQRTPFGKQLSGFLLVADPPQGRQHVGERRFFLLAVPGSEGKAKELMTRLVEPNHHQAVDESTPWARFARRPWEGDWPGPPDPRAACSFQRCIRWPSDRRRPRGFAWRSNRAWCSRTSGRVVSLPGRAPRRWSGVGRLRPCSRGLGSS